VSSILRALSSISGAFLILSRTAEIFPGESEVCRREADPEVEWEEEVWF
jgi:hypothetical protein